MFGIMKERCRTGRGKEYELSLVRPWYSTTQDLSWHCKILATPLPQSLSQDQNVQIRIRLPRLLLAQLGMETEEPPEDFTQRGVLRLGVQLLLEEQSAPSGEVKLLFTGEGLRLESIGKTEINDFLSSWGQEVDFSISTMIAQLEKALSEVREQSTQIGFH